MKKQRRVNNWVEDYFFLVVPHPLEDELLSSWLTRMATKHFQKLSSFFTLFIKKEGSLVSRTDIDFLYDEKLFDYISLKSGLDKQNVLKMSLRSEEGYLFSCNNCLYPPKQIRKLKDKRTHHGLMFCPKCLSEDTVPYYRKYWRYYFYNACTKHKVFLTDRCWSCYQEIRLDKINRFQEICFCSKCNRDLRLTTTVPIYSNFEYGLKAIRWFKIGLNRGYFIIDKQKINSLFVFQIFTKLCCMLNNIRPLVLDFFPLLDEYKIICNKLNLYNSKKTLSIQKDFVLTAMVYYLFQNYPNNLLNFIKQNKLTYREFIHGFNDIPFWYKEIVGSLIPPQNKIGRLISENEVMSAIRYLRSIDKIVNQKNVADVIGCHYTVHRQFVRIYKQIIEFNNL